MKGVVRRMNRSSNELDGTIGSFMRVTKREDGQWEASFPHDKGVPSGVAGSEQEAINRARTNIQAAVASGKAGNY